MPKEIDYEFKRGDTKALKKFRPVDINNNPLILSENDKIYFTVKRGEKGKKVLQKTIGEGIVLKDDVYYHITLNADDTAELDAGSYRYDIELNMGTNLVITLIEGEIILLQDITTKEDKV